MIEAKEPKREMKIEFRTEKGHEHKMFKDEREKDRTKALLDDKIWSDDDESDDDYKC